MTSSWCWLINIWRSSTRPWAGCSLSLRQFLLLLDEFPFVSCLIGFPVLIHALPTRDIITDSWVLPAMSACSLLSNSWGSVFDQHRFAYISREWHIYLVRVDFFAFLVCCSTENGGSILLDLGWEGCEVSFQPIILSTLTMSVVLVELVMWICIIHERGFARRLFIVHLFKYIIIISSVLLYKFKLHTDEFKLN